MCFLSFFVSVVFRKGPQNLGNGLFAIFLRWPFKIQLVLPTANCTHNFATLFGGDAQNLHLSTSLAGISNNKGKVAASTCR